MYGTAWKEDATEACVLAALEAGFRAIDTANQRKHYYEQGVGRAIARSGVPRAELFIQTKFTFRDGQDHRLPYNPNAPVRDQVRQSHDVSLAHLGIAKLDSYVLHGPSQRDGLGAIDREAWRAMEALPVGSLGISNVTASQLRELLAFASVKPRYVQNRCYASTGWDADVRAICRAEGLVYQGFSLLTANRSAVARLAPLAAKYEVQPPQIVFRFAQQVGMLPLTGTKDPRHMRQDLACDELTLTPDEIAMIEKLG
ncbi:MAG TPA: aldo/keto reductase [Kofleriaceae bacterium]|nr:aldo/keto reductase [Kofleriaceae bacterium]